MKEIEDFLTRHVVDDHSTWAWANIKPVLRALQNEFSAKRVLELGGGRSPMFSKEEIDDMGVNYTVNDLLKQELDRAPPWVKKVCFDVSAEHAGHDGKYDLVFSNMLIEHIPNTEGAYRNIYRLLSKGGVFLNFHPVLYAPPFVINAILPETLSRSLLKLVWPMRNNDGIPKFPADYSYCVINNHSREMLKRTGFSYAKMVPFYGHTYFVKLPIIRDLDRALEQFARRRKFTLFASYAYTIGRK